MSTEQLTMAEQIIYLLGDAMNARARDAGDAAEGYCPVETAYENAADSAANLLRDLAEVRRVGGRV
jgi:hypothetical protein